jgi:membrane dipeptidase
VTSSYLVVDGHEDIAWNALSFGRDYRHSADWIRQKEKGTQILAQNGSTLLGKSDWRNGHVAVIFGTLFAAPHRKALGDWDNQSYSSPHEAHQLLTAQTRYYKDLAEFDPDFVLIQYQSDLEKTLAAWNAPHETEELPIGIVILMEGADAILTPESVYDWYDNGVRLIGPSWVGTRYAGGTHEPGPLTSLGRELLTHMQKLNLVLDFSHLAEEACYNSLDLFDGTIVATHANPRRFLPSDRGLSDEMISLISERDGVIGIVPYNRFLRPGWNREMPRELVTLDTLIEAVDYVCQLTGSARHVGIGTDFDGGFGVEQTPHGINTIADISKIAGLLGSRGYIDSDISHIMSENWLRILRKTLPD